MPPELGANMLWANMLLHTQANPLALLRRWHAAVAVDGFVMFSCLGPQTVQTLSPVSPAYRRYALEINHIHLSENDRGIVGRGHVPWRETFRAIRATGYDGWLTVEAFGQSAAQPDRMRPSALVGSMTIE